MPDEMRPCQMCGALAFVHLPDGEGQTGYIVSPYTPEHIAYMEAVVEDLAATTPPSCFDNTTTCDETNGCLCSFPRLARLTAYRKEHGLDA